MPSRSNASYTWRLDPDVLRVARVRAGLTREELATRIGRSAQSVGLYERGVMNPDPDIIVAIADALGVEPLDIMARRAA